MAVRTPAQTLRSHAVSRMLPIFFILLILAPAAGVAQEITLKIDGYVDGQAAGFQGGFVAGEIGAVRLTPPGPFPMQLKQVLFLFGGASGQRQVVLRIYNDSGGTVNPGAEIFSNAYLVNASDTALQLIDLTAENVSVTGPIRVGIEMTQAGFPSIARDNDGDINSSLNFILAQGMGWVESQILGLTGDWVIRAVVSGGGTTYTVGGTVSGLNGTLVLRNNGGDNLTVTSDGPFTFVTPLADGADYNVTVLSDPIGQECVVTNGSGTISGANVTDVTVTCTDLPTTPVELKNDSFMSGQVAGFQAGFASGEIGAVRLVPAATSQILAVRFLFGGAAGSKTLRLHIWDDSGGTLNPGAELFAQDYLITAADDALQQIDLSSESVQVDGPFRVGIELQHAGVPSLARDNDGIDTSKNFIYAIPGNWVFASDLGLIGDWIIRAVVLEETVPTRSITWGQVKVRYGSQPAVPMN